MRRTTLLVVAVALTASACGGSSAPRAPAGSAFHQAHPAEGETPEVAALLVDVPGYRYLDATEPEIQNFLEGVRIRVVEGAWSGGSLHSVIDSQGREVAFLQLYGFVPAAVSASQTSDIVSAMFGARPTSRSIIAGRQVFLFEDPEVPASRYTYMWQMGNTVIAADSGDDEQILRWIRAYLSES